jgi:Fis family transcriptional regulator, factor for inversion stimulation protein
VALVQFLANVIMAVLLCFATEACPMIEKKLTPAKPTREGLRALVEQALQQYFIQLDGQLPKGLYGMYMSQVEPPLIEAVLRYTGGNKSLAAELLDLSRTTLMSKIKKYQLPV